VLTSEDKEMTRRRGTRNQMLLKRFAVPPVPSFDKIRYQEAVGKNPVFTLLVVL
jgi:hypothetical protein